MLGESSTKALDTAHPKLQRLMREVDKRLSKRKLLDLHISCGHRGQADQEKAFREGNSDKHWPDSRHNTLPSTAVDVEPYPQMWSDPELLMFLIGYIQAVADDMGIEVEVGALWHKRDRPHVQLTAYELSRP
jgi:peptidoglycan L-alanyl-D-glutamate endopeptidase CwlK